MARKLDEARPLVDRDDGQVFAVTLKRRADNLDVYDNIDIGWDVTVISKSASAVTWTGTVINVSGQRAKGSQKWKPILCEVAHQARDRSKRKREFGDPGDDEEVTVTLEDPAGTHGSDDIDTEVIVDFP